jgi:large subunit ribosomal protein L15
MSILSKLKPPNGAKRAPNRVGRGPGSGNGKTCGRGMNGQNSRSGSGGKLHFEGGQMPLMRRLPKRGFRNPFTKNVANINVAALDVFDNGTEVTVELLQERRLITGKFDLVKILGHGDLGKKLTVKAHAFSAGAVAKIEQAGGTIEIVPSRTPRADASEAGAPAANASA